MNLEPPGLIRPSRKGDVLIPAQHHARARRRFAADHQAGPLSLDRPDARRGRPPAFLTLFLVLRTLHRSGAARQRQCGAEPCDDNPTFHPDPRSDMPMLLR